MSDLMIIECKNCGRAYKGRIDKPFLCPKCIEEGVTLDPPKVEEVEETKKIEEPKKELPILFKNEQVSEKSNFELNENNITGVNPKPVNNKVDAEDIHDQLNRIETEVLELSQFLHKIFR